MVSPSPRTVRAVLFDVDGTLLDSNDAHARSWHRALEEHDHAVSLEEVRRLIGMGSDKLLPAVAGVGSDSDAGREIEARKSAVFEELLRALGPTRGSRALVDRLRQEGVRLGLATSSKKEDVTALLTAAGVADLFDDRGGAEADTPSKPDPDIVQDALARLGAAADAALMIGDTPYDIEAASRAGVGVIALRCGGWSDAELAGAIAIYDDPADLLSHFEVSPLAHVAA